jgi:hypothetical protein
MNNYSTWLTDKSLVSQNVGSSFKLNSVSPLVMLQMSLPLFLSLIHSVTIHYRLIQ